MNIGKANSTVVQQLNQPIGESRAGKTIESSGQFSPDDHTQISNLSSYLAAALSSSPAHLLKLDTLATAISSGLYHVDAGVISDNIIGQNLGLGAA